MTRFFEFAQDICAKSGRSRTRDQCLASTVMCRHFLTAVAKEGKGVTRPRSARAALSKSRMRKGWVSLNSDPAISEIVAGAEAAEPRTKKQSAGLTSTMVKYVCRGWNHSVCWWRRQVATITSLGFVSLMRLGEICSLQRADVRAAFADGREYCLRDMQVLPVAAKVKGLLFHLPWRKNHRAKDCWVPVACRATIAMILRHEQTLRKKKCTNESLFPSGIRRAANKKVMNPTNWISEQSWVRGLQKALVDCVPLMSPRWAELYTGHCMRVGGSNEMRRLGISDDIHRRLGGWMSLTSAQGYMALSAREQFAYTLKLAQTKRRHDAMTKQAALLALPQLRRGRLW